MTRMESFVVRRFPAMTAVLALAMVPLAACGSSDSSTQGPTVSITHAQGTTDVPQDPAAVVVLDFGVLDTINTLGLGERVVGVPSEGRPRFLDAFSTVEGVGTMQEPDVEKIAEIDPDLIVIGPRTAERYADLSKLAPTLDLSVDSTEFIDANAEQATSIGTVFGKESQVTAELAQIDAAVTRGTAAAGKSGDAMVLLTSGGKVSAYGPGSRFAIIHDVLGVEPTVRGLKQDRHGQAVSFEFIAKNNPSRMFVIDRDAAIGEDGAAAKEVLDNALVGRTTAWKKGDVTYLDGQRWYVAGTGLDNVEAMVNEVVKGLA